MEEWIRADKRHPKDGQRVICIGKRGGIRICKYNASEIYYNTENQNVVNPTHWMPLPQPPKEET